MQLCLIQPRSFSPQPLASLSKDILSSFSSSSLSHSFLSLSARCPGLNFLCTRTLPFQKQLREQPKTQRETEHIDRLSLNCIAPAQTDIMCFGEMMHVCLPPCLYMHVCRVQEWTALVCVMSLVDSAYRQSPMYAILSCVSTLEFLPFYVFLRGSGWRFAPVEKVECGTPPLPLFVSGHMECKTKLKRCCSIHWPRVLYSSQLCGDSQLLGAREAWNVWSASLLESSSHQQQSLGDDVDWERLRKIEKERKKERKKGWFHNSTICLTQKNNGFSSMTDNKLLEKYATVPLNVFNCQ